MYYKRLDGLRFFAIFFVLIHHFASFFSNFINFGYYGVDLFFVISGFLITTILLKAKEKSFWKNYGNFMGRRVLRIFPLYYFSIFLLFILGVPGIKKYLIPLITYTFNYYFPFLENNEGNSFGHFWSLCVEEQFYLFWPFLVLYIKRWKSLLLFITLTIILFAFLQIKFNIISSISAYNYSGLPARMGSLGMGALGAYFAFYNRLSRVLFNSLQIEISFFALLIIALIYHLPFLLALSSLFLVIKSTVFEFNIKPINRLLSNKYIIYVGTISYGIYIYHIPIGYYLMPKIFDPFWNSIDFTRFGPFEILKWHSWIIKFPLYSALSVLIAGLSFKYFEKPILSYKDKLFKYS